MKKGVLTFVIFLGLALIATLAGAETSVTASSDGKWTEVWWTFTSATDGTLTAEGDVQVSGTPVNFMYFNGTVATTATFTINETRRIGSTIVTGFDTLSGQGVSLPAADDRFDLGTRYSLVETTLTLTASGLGNTTTGRVCLVVWSE